MTGSARGTSTVSLSAEHCYNEYARATTITCLRRPAIGGSCIEYSKNILRLLLDCFYTALKIVIILLLYCQTRLSLFPRSYKIGAFAMSSNVMDA